MTQIPDNEGGSGTKVVLEEGARRQFDRLPFVIRGRVREMMRRLHAWPDVSGAKLLTGPWAGHYRMRTGDYRLQFFVRSESEEGKAATLVVIEKIGHRDRFYER